jgi:hypothetical protein
MPYVKGQSGNPHGRPKKGKGLTDLLEKTLAKNRADGKRGKAALAEALVALAIDEKDIAAIKYVYDRVDGRPRESVTFGDSAIETKLMEVLGNG